MRSRPDDMRQDGQDGQRRISEKLGEPPANAAIAWNAATQRFKTALAAGDTLEVDRVSRDFALRFPFSRYCGMANCARGGLRLDYSSEESARPFYDRALHEFSDDEQVRALAMLGDDTSRRLKSDKAKIDTNQELDTSLSAIGRQLDAGNHADRIAGLKSLSALIVDHPGEVVRAPSPDNYPRYQSLTTIARVYAAATLSESERAAFNEPLARRAQNRVEQALLKRDPLSARRTGLQRFSLVRRPVPKH